MDRVRSVIVDHSVIDATIKALQLFGKRRLEGLVLWLGNVEAGRARVVRAFVPRQRSLLQLCALAGAVTIAIQLPATHWYYYYIMWFLPFALVAFAARPALAPAPATEAARREWTIQPAEHEPAMAGA